MISTATVIAFLLSFMVQNPTSSTLTDLQTIQSAVMQDISTLENGAVTVANPVQTTNTNQTQGVVQGVNQSPIAYNFTPGSLDSNSTTTITITASQGGVFDNTTTFNVNGFVGSKPQFIEQITPTVSTDGSQANFDVNIPDGYSEIQVVEGQTALATLNVRSN